jgi:opacity protein-like surface antigen
MKRAIVAVVLVFVVALGANAQMKWGAGAQAGLAFSSFPKPASDYFGIGFGFGAHGDVEFMKYVGARFNFDYRMFSSDKSKFTDIYGQPIPSSDISGGNVSIISFGLEGLGKLPLKGSPVTPYGLFGLGLNISSTSDLMYKGQTALTSESKTNFGIDFGVGAEFKIAKTVSLFGEFKFLLIFTEGSSTSIFPLTVGATFWF